MKRCSLYRFCPNKNCPHRVPHNPMSEVTQSKWGDCKPLFCGSVAKTTRCLPVKEKR